MLAPRSSQLIAVAVMAALGARTPVFADDPEPACGDGAVSATEECDDGNTEPGDGCSATCQNETPPHCIGAACLADAIQPREATCGDGDLDADEECDDGNTEDDDGCSSACELE